MKVLALIVFGCLIARADTIELKTGEKIEGSFKQAGAAGAVIEIGGQPVTFAIDKVRAIYLGAAVAAPIVNASAEALTALKSLRSVTTSGINYRDYSTRVLDAKVVIDTTRRLRRHGACGLPTEGLEDFSKWWISEHKSKLILVRISRLSQLMGVPFTLNRKSPYRIRREER